MSLSSPSSSSLPPSSSPSRRWRLASLPVVALCAVVGLAFGPALAHTAFAAGEGASSGARAPVVLQTSGSDQYKVTVEPAKGKAGTELTAKVKLDVVASDKHINKTYPYKVELKPVDGVELLGKDAGNKGIFSKTTGDFEPKDVSESTKSATITVHFKVAKAGSGTLPGTLKLSVCSDKDCLMDKTDIAVPYTAN